MAFDFSDNVQKMFSALTSAADLRTNVANTLLSSGINLMQSQKYSEAASAFRQAAAMQPDLTEAYTYQGDAYARLGKRKEAIDAYKMSLKVDKTQDTVYTTLAGVYIDNGQKSEAEKVLKDGIKQNNQNTLAYYMLGQLQAQNGDYTSAEANFRQVIKLEPKDGNGYYALGMALNGQEKYDEAVEALQKATDLKADFSPALLELGRAYAGLGEKDKAQEIVDTLTEIATSDSLLSAEELAAEIKQPKISYYNSTKSSLKLDLSAVNLVALSSAFMEPSATKDFTVKFAFDSEMDISSVVDPLNWRISKASGGTTGLYNNGLYSARDTSVPYLPKSVSYDPTTRQATLTFTLRQKADTNGGTFDPITEGGILDPSHLVFKFLGKDANGKSMDPTADQYEAWKGEVF
ncbi:tetratricopeptide repeat protein [Trichlorobacter lovleyi]|uniref:TPR repeat-containing protein n=1 Tax=Trichlorobacter lovleyi (strain ATCC BAA-1151 / DSM 17278 / SZ) TaxID=398767 RepID=B3EBL9_TRIL1|nr:tetratricopeptide repeat protein [Trichlorobacter lovleyi]ACD97058.1 TPR repeat-containing protein [Trichlorobacter lovleyi SZ]